MKQMIGEPGLTCFYVLLTTDFRPFGQVGLGDRERLEISKR
jgi:hypothetical protein